MRAVQRRFLRTPGISLWTSIVGGLLGGACFMLTLWSPKLLGTGGPGCALKEGLRLRVYKRFQPLATACLSLRHRMCGPRCAIERRVFYFYCPPPKPACVHCASAAVQVCAHAVLLLAFGWP